MSTIAQQLLDEMIAEAIAEERAIIKAEKEQMKKEFATKLLRHSKMSKPEISLMTDVPLSEVEAIAKELNSSKPTL